MNTCFTSHFDNEMMSRALQLASLGYGFTSPNPMVGAVVTDSAGNIIGEGFHRQWGGPHAEVNALASVRDKTLLSEATVYVTLEPCSHYGKTPPCAKLLIDNHVRRVVIGCPDPFDKVRGRGVAMLRQAGIEVCENVMRDRCERLNHKFIYAHTAAMPYVTLKWAQSSDGYIAMPDGSPVQLSTPLSALFMHRERAGYDAIMVGTNTIRTDNPSLTCRLWPHRRLRPVVIDAHGNIPSSARLLANPDTIIIDKDQPLEQTLRYLYTHHGITSLLVEGGTKLHQSFLKAGLYNKIRVEVANIPLYEGVSAPTLPGTPPNNTQIVDYHAIMTYYR